METTGQIRKIEIKVVLEGWRWIDTSEMTFEDATSKAYQAADKVDGAYGIKVSRLGRFWVEEFSGDTNGNYIGVEL